MHFPSYSFPSGSEVLPDSSSVSPQLDSWGHSGSKASLSVCSHLSPLLTAFLVASPSWSLLFPCWLRAEGAGLSCGGCLPLPPPAAPPASGGPSPGGHFCVSTEPAACRRSAWAAWPLERLSWWGGGGKDGKAKPPLDGSDRRPGGGVGSILNISEF